LEQPLDDRDKDGPAVLALVPARGGSKTVPRKNIRLLAGKPLIAWTIETAIACHSISRVIVSTDDDEIAEVARAFGAEVPFRRPADLARDDTPDLPVWHHALTWLADHERYLPRIVAWLRPTAPLTAVADVEGAIRLLMGTHADWVRSVSRVKHHPYWMKRLDRDRLLPFIDGADEVTYHRRQLLPPAYKLNGAVDVTWRRTVMTSGLIFQGDVRGYVMDANDLDIDDEFDFVVAEALMQRRLR
jgi:CMP-N-acetylneuraminic acid synthetase